jgi:predicted transcriptional regulator
MADPKLQIEQRVDRIELAVSTMAQWLVQAQTGFGAKDAEGIEKILKGAVHDAEEVEKNLRGEKPEESKADTES